MAKMFEKESIIYNMDNDKEKLNSNSLYVKCNKYENIKMNFFKKINYYSIFICFLLILSILLLINMFELYKIIFLYNNKRITKNYQNSYLSPIIKKKDIKICICTLGKEENKYYRL